MSLSRKEKCINRRKSTDYNLLNQYLTAVPEAGLKNHLDYRRTKRNKDLTGLVCAGKF
jgi:hypothetical protein